VHRHADVHPCHHRKGGGAGQEAHLCEKPMALTLDEADAMIAAARRADVILQIGFTRRFDSAFRIAKERNSAKLTP
jgi:hypothetical protein